MHSQTKCTKNTNDCKCKLASRCLNGSKATNEAREQGHIKCIKHLDSHAKRHYGNLAASDADHLCLAGVMSECCGLDLKIFIEGVVQKRCSFRINNRR